MIFLHRIYNTSNMLSLRTTHLTNHNVQKKRFLVEVLNMLALNISNTESNQYIFLSCENIGNVVFPIFNELMNIFFYLFIFFLSLLVSCFLIPIQYIHRIMRLIVRNFYYCVESDNSWNNTKVGGKAFPYLL